MRYAKTEAGQQAFKQRSSELSARQRAVFILFDGQRTLADVLKATSGLGIVEADIEDLLTKGFLQPPAAAPQSDPAAVAQAVPDLKTDAQVFMQATRLATQLSAQLGLRGFRLNLAVEAALNKDDLVALLPKLTDALGAEAVRPLKELLGNN
jgi:hypothetical protein